MPDYAGFIHVNRYLHQRVAEWQVGFNFSKTMNIFQTKDIIKFVDLAVRDPCGAVDKFSQKDRQCFCLA